MRINSKISDIFEEYPDTSTVSGWNRADPTPVEVMRGQRIPAEQMYDVLIVAIWMVLDLGSKMDTNVHPPILFFKAEFYFRQI